MNSIKATAHRAGVLYLLIAIIKSRFIPKLIGVLLIVGCFAYLVVCFTAMVFPAHGQLVFQVMMPFYAIGELAIIIWLLVKGAKVQEPEARPAQVS